MTVADRQGKLIYVSQCVFAHDVSIDAFEQMFELTLWPHDEAEEEDECVHLHAALNLIGAWAQFAVPLDSVTDMYTGAVSIVIAPTTRQLPPTPQKRPRLRLADTQAGYVWERTLGC